MNKLSPLILFLVVISVFLLDFTEAEKHSETGQTYLIKNAYFERGDGIKSHESQPFKFGLTYYDGVTKNSTRTVIANEYNKFNFTRSNSTNSTLVFEKFENGINYWNVYMEK